MDSAYICDQDPTESRRMYRKTVYRTLLYYTQATAPQQEMRIQQLWPSENRQTIWKNLCVVLIPAHQRARWYKVIHDLVRTNTRLHAIHLTATDSCRHCTHPDTLHHRRTQCGTGVLIWNWMAAKIANILRMAPRHIPKDWLLRPSCKIRPVSRKRAVLWLLAQVIIYHTDGNQASSLLEYKEHVRSQKTNLYDCHNRRKLVANYLTDVDEPP
jgi:hypothetical protein